MSLNTSIGLKIANLRKEHGLTQELLAEKLDISIKHCSSVERGLSCLSLEKLIEVSDFFDISLDYLVRENSINRDSINRIYYALPPSIVSILNSQDEKEIELFYEYLRFYSKIRDNQEHNKDSMSFQTIED